MIKILFFSILILLPITIYSQLSDKDQELLRTELAKRINELRIEKGLKPLLFNDTLKEAAKFHSVYMSENKVLGHEEKSSKFATPKKRVIAFGGKDFELVGENVLYSRPREFPLNRKEIIELADEMFTSWKNSPGHYANMTEPEYVMGDLGFNLATDKDPNKKIVYATHVFGTKGYVVQDQISSDAFGLDKAPEDCDQEFRSYSNLIMNLGNDLRIKGNEVLLYYHDIARFRRTFSGPRDGIAVDLISEGQMACGRPNQLDFSPVYDGILLKPYYSGEMLADNRAEGDYRIVTKVGDIPAELEGKEWSPSVVLIKNGKACKYLYPAYVPRKAYELKPFEPFRKDEQKAELLRDGVIRSEIVHYDFKTNITRSINMPRIEGKGEEVHSVVIRSYSSVEGDSINNEKLHNARAAFIKAHVKSELGVSEELVMTDARENWELMDFQLNYFQRDDLSLLSHDSLKALLASGDRSLPWDSLLFEQRKATAVINYAGTYSDVEKDMSLEAFNLRTAVATENPILANKALYEMYEALVSFAEEETDFDSGLLFEPQIVSFIWKYPETVTNYSALLSHIYYLDPYAITRFIHHWLKRGKELDYDSRSNLLHLYTLVGTYLLDNWDVSSERLSNVIHPLKVNALNPDKIKDELMLNLHLTFIRYFDQINDGPNISKSFYFIADYFKSQALKAEEDVDLALFFNYWSMYHMTVEHLLHRFKENRLNEDGLFILAETMNFTNYKDESGVYIEINKKALESNTERWCNWLNMDFQVKRNFQIKRFYCEKCR